MCFSWVHQHGGEGRAAPWAPCRTSGSWGPMCPLTTALGHHEPRAGTAAPFQQMWRLNRLSSVLLTVVIWNDFCGYLLRLFCLHCKVFGPGRHLQMFGLRLAWCGHLGCYHKFFSHPSFPLLPVRNMEICLPITFSTTLGTKIYIHKTDFQIFFLDWYRLNGLLP